jgi:hypothetical protein
MLWQAATTPQAAAAFLLDATRSVMLSLVVPFLCLSVINCDFIGTFQGKPLYDWAQ